MRSPDLHCSTVPADEGRSSDEKIDPARPPSRLSLQFASDGNRTGMSICRQDQPWRAIRAFSNELGAAVVHLHNVSGGVLSGDRMELSIEAKSSSRVQITTVGATRIYRRRPGRTMARISTAIRVEAGALVEYLPDATIPFSGSSFSQSTMIFLAPNAGYIGWETIAAGRIAREERFQFERFHSEFGIYSDGRPIALEQYVLEPSIRTAASAARWGRFCYTSALFVCHTGIDDRRWRQIESSANELASTRTTSWERWGASALVSGGIVVRGLAMEAYQSSDSLRAFWQLIKKELWGEPAIPPRKIY